MEQNNKTMKSSVSRKHQVTRADLPLHCPMPGMALWDSHPRVFIPIEEEGKAICPYCGAEYTLVD